jgi:hypothetical protein
MSAQRPSSTEAFLLTRIRESFAEWFDSFDPELVAHPTTPSVELDPPELILVRGAGELHPATAGAMAGGLAGPAAMGVATILATKTHHPADLAGTIAALVTHGGSHAHWIAWTTVVAFGAVLGAMFATITRRLRSFPPMIAFGVILSACAWTVIHSLALPRVAPWLAHMLPYAPMVIAAAVFGALLAVQVPIRTRRLV